MLTAYLQREFERLCPAGWRSSYERSVLPPELAGVLGYNARADVLLERLDGTRRLWIEFEVSRADPVANHVKFATAHLFHPQLAGDAFVAMVSSHVTRGRRNLAANTIWLMRALGMAAFQTELFPQLRADEVKRLNHLPLEALLELRPAVEPELARVLAVTETRLTIGEHRVHFAGNLSEVLANVRQWNAELRGLEGKLLWIKRTILYFAYDPGSGLFAPSKFCAFIATPPPARPAEMTLALYSQLDETESRFDGAAARRHLTRGLGMTGAGDPGIRARFDTWLQEHTDCIDVHPRGPVLLVPPAGFI